jgi:formylglycine-generating enzyme required for sulfatase activity
VNLPASWTNPKDGSLMQRIPAGDFIMGSTEEQIDEAISLDQDGPRFALSHESPQFRAHVPDFYLAVYPVTNQQFAAFLATVQPSAKQLEHWASRLERIEVNLDQRTFAVKPGFERHPAVHVSWEGAEAYAGWANLRLPTEIEWEKAARGTDGRIFPWGNDWQSDALSWWNTHDADHDTATVDQFVKGVSPFGICQMTGNVEEWCADPYRHDVYHRYAQGDLEMPKAGIGRVLRGGNCMFSHRLGFRCAMRSSNPASLVNILYTGIRCASDRPVSGDSASVDEL